MTRVLICGGRDFTDREAAFAALDQHVAGATLVIHGGAKGADTIAGEWAQARGIPVEVYMADWARDKRAAGPIRNKRMLVEGKPDLVVALPGGKGTAHMVGIARKAGVTVVHLLGGVE